jgi:hypothetical protein
VKTGEHLISNMPGKSDDDCGAGRGAEEQPAGTAEQQQVAAQPPVMDVMGGTFRDEGLVY